MALHLSQLQHQIIVSVQADEGEPLNSPACLLALAQSALNGGATALRLAQPKNIAFIRQALPHVPIIGITKPDKAYPDAESRVYITPTHADALAVFQAGANIVAMDATMRPRMAPLEAVVSHVRKQAPEALLMADIATEEDALEAARLGFDCVGTTLSGYTLETRHKKAGDVPDFELLCALVSKLTIPVILEGRVWEPEHVAHAFSLGAHAVVIGSAITRPQLITKRFVQAVPTLVTSKAITE